MNQPGRPMWPPLMRVVLLMTLTLGVMVAMRAAQDAALAMTVETVTPPDTGLGPFRDFIPYAKEQEAALHAQERATLNAIEQMATPRAIITALLAGVAMLIFVTSVQIRWSPEAPPVSLAQRLGVLALAAAVLRTLDGAQDLVIVRRALEASGKVLVGTNIPDAARSIELTRTLLSVASVAWTAVMVTLFFAVGAYFRSDKVQATFVIDED
jgi:hypothetical protein